MENKTEPQKKPTPGRQLIKRAPLARSTAKILPAQRQKRSR